MTYLLGSHCAISYSGKPTPPEFVARAGNLGLINVSAAEIFTTSQAYVSTGDSGDNDTIYKIYINKNTISWQMSPLSPLSPVTTI